MRISRFYVPGASGPDIELDRSESTHALRVLRLHPGDRIVVFGGDGFELDCEIVEARSRVRARVLDRRPAGRELPHRIVVASAVPKGERLEFMIQKLAELGVAEYRPVRFARSVARIEGGKVDRLQRVASEASKQCGRGSVLRVGPEVACPDLGSGAFFVAVPDAPKHLIRADGGRDRTLVIGPEGGMTEDEERLLLGRGGAAVSLGPTILRIETAAIAGAGILAGL